MQLSSCVEATKFLRDRSVAIGERAGVAQAILLRENAFYLPRKESVLLDWALDALKDEHVCRKPDVWKLLPKIWPVVPVLARARSFRNHRFVVYLTMGLSTPTLTPYVTTAFSAIAASGDPLEFASEQHVTALLLAYLANKAAVTDAAFRDFKRSLLQSLRLQPKVFSGKLPENALDLVLSETDADFLAFLLADYVGRKELPVHVHSDVRVPELIQAVLKADVDVEARMEKILAAAPLCTSLALREWDRLRPTGLSPEIARKFLLLRFAHEEIETVLELRPAAVFDSVELTDQVLETAGKRLSADARMMVLLLEAASTQRKLLSVLLDWKYTGDYPASVTTELHQTLQKVVSVLSGKEISTLLKVAPPALPLVVGSLSYRVASMPPVRERLQALCNSDDVDENVKLQALNVCPSLTVSEAQTVMLQLRRVELRLTDEARAGDIVRNAGPNKDRVAVRYFPLLSIAVSPQAIESLLAQCTPETRALLARTDSVLDHPKFTEALVSVLIAMSEFDALAALPKSAFLWAQRHSLVTAALSQPFTGTTGKLVSELLDAEQLPDAECMRAFIQSAREEDAESVVQILHKFKKQSQLGAKLHGWQKTCADAVEGHAVKLDEEHALAMGTIADLLPVSAVRTLVLHCVSTRGTISDLAFARICNSGFHWSLVTALYSAAGCPDRLEAAYSAYCRALPRGDLLCLYMQCSAEDQFQVLRCLVARDVIPYTAFSEASEDQTVQPFNFVFCICRPGKPSREYWQLCEAILRATRKDMLSQFCLEYLLQLISEQDAHFSEMAVVLSRIMVLKRGRLHGRVHLLIAALQNLMQLVENHKDAEAFTRLVDNLCNPTKVSKQTLKSVIARERRIVQRHAPVLVANFVALALQNPAVGNQLRESMLLVLDLLGAQGLRSLAATLDASGQAYLRGLFDEYKRLVQWLGD